MLGDLYANQHKNELSISSYRKAHELAPPQPLVHVRLIQMYLRSGMMKEAEEELKHVDQAIKDGTNNKELFVESAQLFTKNSRN